jgi:hypothetical protein
MEDAPMKYTLLLLLALSGSAIANGNVDFLEVDGDTVFFSTSGGKSHSLPSCVATDNSALWTLSLTSDSGRAMYSLVLTAMAKGDELAIDVVSQGNCTLIDGYEQAANVSLIPVDNSESSGSSASGSNGTNQHPLAGTIFEHFMVVGTTQFANRQYGANSQSFYTNATQNGGSAYNGRLSSTNRTQLVNHTGSGWVTNIVLPATDNYNYSNSKPGPATIEIIIDGVTYSNQIPESAASNRFNRYVMGLFDGYKDGTTTNILAYPEMVVSQGMGIPFKQSLEVWEEMNDIITSNYDGERWLVQFLEGNPL